MFSRSYQILALMLLVTVLVVSPDSTAYAGVWDGLVINIRNSVSDFPKIITTVCYLFGLIFAISAILRFKKHVDDPRSEPLNGPVVRLIIGGCLLAFPVVVRMMVETIGEVAAGVPADIPAGAGSDGLGGLLENLQDSFSSPARLFAVIAYLFGISFGVWSLFEFVKSADSPQQAPLKRPIMIALTGSALLSLPTIVAALRSTFDTSTGVSLASGPALAGTQGGMALDQILVNFVTNIHGPLIDLVGHVSFIAGLAFALVGVFRLMKNAQDGPKSPWGMGTIGTFLTAAALLSLNNMLGATQMSVFGSTTISTYAVLADAQGMDPLIASRANDAIQAVFMFVQLVGWVSFVRGLFIFRAYGEGNGQATMAAGFTHIIGGAIAVNLSAFVNAVQLTLGLVGLTFI